MCFVYTIKSGIMLLDYFPLKYLGIIDMFSSMVEWKNIEYIYYKL